jgi:hypothetical protein
MRIDLIIKDVNVTVAQKILGLLDNTENVTIEQVVEATPVVTSPTNKVPLEKAFKEAKTLKRKTCAACGDKYVYINSHSKHCKAGMKKEEPKPLETKAEPVKATPKFVREIKVPSKPVKKEQPKYEGISDDHLTDMVISVLTANLNAIVTSAQISSSYIAAQTKKFGDTTEVKELKKTLEPRVVTLLEKAAKALGPSHCMSMPIAPNGVQVALFATGVSIKDLEKKLN